MVLNARKIFATSLPAVPPVPPLILLAMEDVTERRLVSEKLAEYAQKIETQIGSKMQNLTTRVDELGALQKTITAQELLLTELREEIKMLKEKISL